MRDEDAKEWAACCTALGQYMQEEDDMMGVVANAIPLNEWGVMPPSD